MQNVWIVTLHTGQKFRHVEGFRRTPSSVEFHFLIEESERNHGGFQMYFETSVGQFEALLLILMQQRPDQPS